MSDGAWVRVGRVSFRRRMAAAGAGAGLFLVVYASVFLGPRLGGLLVPAAPGWLAAIGGALLGLVLAAVALGISAVRSRGFAVRADGSAARVRGRSVPASVFDRASLLTERAFGPRRNLLLELHAGRAVARIWLRSGDRVLLAPDEQDALVRLLERSSVAPPPSAFDPTGRFSRVEFPGSLTRADAVDVVRRIPKAGERLPLTD